MQLELGRAGAGGAQDVGAWPLQLSEQRLGRRCEDLSEAPPPALGPLGLLRPVT